MANLYSCVVNHCEHVVSARIFTLEKCVGLEKVWTNGISPEDLKPDPGDQWWSHGTLGRDTGLFRVEVMT